MQFGVSALPKQEVGQSLLAAGPDDEIYVAKLGFLRAASDGGSDRARRDRRLE
jgi:hypothetical protein